MSDSPKCLICGGPLGHPVSIRRGLDQPCADRLEKNSLPLFMELQKQADTMRDLKLMFQTLEKPVPAKACSIALASAERLINRIQDRA